MHAGIQRLWPFRHHDSVQACPKRSADRRADCGSLGRDTLAAPCRADCRTLPGAGVVLSFFFHRWEQHLAAVTKDRVVRPFDWGIDWLPANGHHDGGPYSRVSTWVDDVMRDTTLFFNTPPTAAYQFDVAAPDAAQKGEAGTLRFPSAF